MDIVMGVDTPEDVARKLHITAAPTACPEKWSLAGKLNPAEKKTQKLRQQLCWSSIPFKDAPDVMARFYDYGVGPVVYDLDFSFPMSSWSWLPGAVEGSLGSADKTDKDWASWSWSHTEVIVRRGEAAELSLTHWPTLRLSTAGVTHRSSSVADRNKAPTPLDLRFGYDHGATVDRKMKAAGFRLSIIGCSDPYPRSRGVAVSRCNLTGGNLTGLRGDTVVEIVNGGGGMGIATLTYNFSPSAYTATVRQLTELYGEPIEQTSLGPHWSVGGVGIEVSQYGDWFTVEYSHGRLKQLSYKAMYDNEAAEKEANKRAF
jgi:hypothetical protein